MRTSFENWLHFGQALASGHPLFFQWVINERQTERERIIYVEDLTWDSLVVELFPHVHLGGAITDISRTSEIPSWKRGLLQMDNINFVNVIWFGTLMISCMLYHALDLLYPLFERKLFLEAWPLFTFEIEFH